MIRNLNVSLMLGSYNHYENVRVAKMKQGNHCKDPPCPYILSIHSVTVQTARLTVAMISQYKLNDLSIRLDQIYMTSRRVWHAPSLFPSCKR